MQKKNEETLYKRQCKNAELNTTIVKILLAYVNGSYCT